MEEEKSYGIVLDIINSDNFMGIINEYIKLAQEYVDKKDKIKILKKGS